MSIPESNKRRLLLSTCASALLAVLLAACGPGAVEEGASFLVYDRDAKTDQYRLTEREIDTLQNVRAGRGRIAKLRGGGSIKINASNPSSKSEFEDSLSIEGSTTPDLDYKVDSGVVTPLDFDTTIMLTLYHHVERAREYFVGIGVDGSRLGRLPIYYNVTLELIIPVNLLTDNAAYAFTLDAMLIPPRLLLKDIPLAANRGVIVHEYSHRVFNRLVHDGSRAPEYLAEPWPDDAVNRMRSLDEGVADIFAGLQTRDADFISDSIANDLFDVDRDLSKRRTYGSKLRETIETKPSSRYNPYKLGSVVASTVWALRPQVDDRDDLAAEIDDALDVVRRPRHGRDLHVADDLADLEDLQAVFLGPESKAQVLAAFRHAVDSPPMLDLACCTHESHLSIMNLWIPPVCFARGCARGGLVHG